jgi:hypothetical protein
MNFGSAIGSTLAALGSRRAWCIDFEFIPRRGDIPEVVCMSARCLITGEEKRLWLYETPTACPFTMANDEVFIAHSSSAEALCFIALDWPVPTRIIDTMVETARLWNGKMTSEDNDGESLMMPSLLRSLAYFGMPARSAAEKESIIDRILRGGPFAPEEVQAILAYCADDANDGGRLLAALMLASDLADPLRFRQAVWRGRGVAALTVVEAIGTPLDMPLLKRFVRHWEAIKSGLIRTMGAAYPGVFREDDSFNLWAFAEYLAQHRIAWPRTAKTKQPDMREETFEKQVELHPELATLAELLKLTNRTRIGPGALAIGPDGRNRTSMRPFATKTSRNAPKGAEFLFTQSAWLRYFVQPPQGRALLVLDWKSQEIGVAGVLSGDEILWSAAINRDPYISFGRQIGQSEEEAESNRPLLKITVLGVQYGMTPQGIAARNKLPLAKAMWLFREHQRVYAKFWAWSLGVAKYACEGFSLETKMGWRIGWPPRSRVKVKATTARNWPVQAGSAETMRLAVALLAEENVALCAVVHDAFICEVPERTVERDLARVMAIMDRASEMFLGEGRRIRISPTIVFPAGRVVDARTAKRLKKAGVSFYLGRYQDPRGAEMFATAMRLLEEAEAKATEGEGVSGGGGIRRR